MCKKNISTLLLFLIHFTISAQTKTDSIHRINEVIVRGYLFDQSLIRSPASVFVIDNRQIKQQSGNSFVPLMNTVPGVRMEERSPGSYRLSIRGSLLRSPFGIRDVKVYFDEIPLTDAGGNTYLNSIDVNSIQGIEVLKGPDGSLFGANSGGVVLINPTTKDKDAEGNLITASLNGGSYGLVHENVSVQNTLNKNQINISQGYQNYDGYRDNSGMKRYYIQVIDQWKYMQSNSIKSIVFYSDLNYQTPGGLTLAEQDANPQLARPSLPKNPGAVEQKAEIFNKMLFGGIVNEMHLSRSLRNVLTVFGTHVNFTNPAITNYGERKENTYGLRTYFELTGTPQKAINWKVNLGFEWQQTNSTIGNYGNNGGIKDTIQSVDDIHTNQNFVFTRFEARIFKRWELEAALSLNNYQYQFKNIAPLPQTSYINRPFDAQLMPRLALSYLVSNNFVWRASVSRGYSTPTIAEVRPTDHVINPSLQAQNGWNYETGFRLRNRDERFFVDASVFYYKLNNAIVRRLHPNGTEYFINTGGTEQPGLELYFSGWLIRQNTNAFIRGLQVNESFTYSKFTFSTDYSDAKANYAGNNLTGVPPYAIITGANIQLPKSFYFFAQYNFTGRLPLNDANTVYASSYHLVQIKAGWHQRLPGKAQIELFAGGDNLLNQKYSLGNDLNAIGGRYFNPSPLRSFFTGMKVSF